ncbi:hypothetical protein BX600DRAFT_438294 [Xylariales sp. PMI_506]|nr:hypothetical protein BX600DRAFT_438294 [Xylariales sp. PMI_506]
MALNCSESVDAIFGPWAGRRCRGGFGFTLFSEQTILVTAPSVIFLLAFPVRASLLAQRQTTTVRGLPFTRESLTAAILMTSRLTLLILWAATNAPKTKISLASVSLNLVTSLLIFALTWLEDGRSVRPSTLLITYFVVTLLLDLAQARTLWLLNINTAIACLFNGSTVTIFREFQCEKNNNNQYKDISANKNSSGMAELVGFMFYIAILWQKVSLSAIENRHWPGYESDRGPVAHRRTDYGFQ